jgi:3-keto-5-aminohexanoate cleavage enzyme
MSNPENKIVITAALTGGATRKDQNPNVPYTKEEFIEEAVKCYEAGASIVHIHVRDPKTGFATPDMEIITPVIEGIRAACPININLSTAIMAGLKPEDRIRPVVELKPEFASLNTGSMNFALFDYKSKDVFVEFLFDNTFATIKKFAKAMREAGTKPELEVYDLGHMYNVKLLQMKGIMDEPLHFNFVFGVAGGIHFKVDHLVSFINLLPEGATWHTCGVGPAQFPLAMMAAALGGHIRVGLEDNIYIKGKDLAQGSWEQVKKAVVIAEQAERAPATPEEARQILNCPARA